MKTIILSGGRGYRLKEETEFKPKPMVLIGGKPILWHIMKIYAQYGFNEFIIALGYKGEQIKDYFLNQKYFLHDFTLQTKTGFTKVHRDKTDGKLIDDFKITFVDTGEETLPGERILLCQPYISEGDRDFMVTYGDGVSDIDINKLVAFHRSQKTIGTVAGVFPRSKFGLLQFHKDSKATAFVEKPVLAGRINGGFMVFQKEVFEYFRQGEYEHPALKRLIQKQQLSVFSHDGFWQCMDTYQDVDYLNGLWNERAPWKTWK